MTQAVVAMQAQSLVNDFPGLSLPADITAMELETIVIGLSQYTGAESINVDPYLSRRGPSGLVEVRIPLWGAIAYLKDMTDKQNGQVDALTGEVVYPSRQAVGVVFKVSPDDDKYMSFTSVAAERFFKKFILPIRRFGDWEQPLAMRVIPIKLQPVGHTYAFSLKAYDESMEGTIR